MYAVLIFSHAPESNEGSTTIHNDVPDWENSARVRFYLRDLVDTFERGSGVKTASVSTADLIGNDEFNEANEEFILLLEIMNIGSDDVQLESEGNGILISYYMDYF